MKRVKGVRNVASRLAANAGFIRDGLLIGQGREFIEILFSLAAAADRAKREL